MQITLFVVSGCPLCQEVREWLELHGIEYGERNVERDYSALRQMFKMTRQRLVPVLKVGEHFSVRPTEEEIARLCLV